jgi:hypothetical protein
LIVDDDDTLIAGKAKTFFFAVSSISAYWSGVATGMVLLGMMGERARLFYWRGHSDSLESHRSTRD